MKNKRRKFIANLTALGVSMGFSSIASPISGKDLNKIIEGKIADSSEDVTEDEAFWKTIRQAYPMTANNINLNNGAVSPSPLVVQEAVTQYMEMCNINPSYYMGRILSRTTELTRQKLATIAGCDADSIAINRNTCEALETVIFGIELQKGDEVVLSKYDYPNMINAWKQRERRDGIVLKFADFPPFGKDETFLAKSYTQLFSKRTKLVHITHMINWTGTLVPVRKIADVAKQKSIKVLVDGAHTFAQLDFNIPDLNCDYFGCSLHKWLCAPIGTGMLYVRKEEIANIYPLLSAPDSVAKDDIRKFEHLGTRSVAIENGIVQAIDFHNLIGAERKEKRLTYLKNYILEKAAKLQNIDLTMTSSKDSLGAIAFLSFSDIDQFVMKKHLEARYGVYTSFIKWERVVGLRLSPNVYTLKEDLDWVFEGMQEALSQK